MFSNEEYLELLIPFREFLMGYREALCSEKFVISRHDVEFDTVRALELAQLEYSVGIKSTYFFQVCSDAYNLASIGNQKILSQIESLGHEVGLHLYTSHITFYDERSFISELRRQTAILESLISSRIEVFSLHRPRAWFLEVRQDYIGTMLNAYGPSFFEYTSEPSQIKYFADSNHSWNYGKPRLLEKFKKYQILTHPDEWYEQPNNLIENYHLTYRAHCERFNATLMSENKKFNELGLINCV